MKKIKEKLTKKIICIIIIVMLCSFIIPNLSFAVSANGGGSLIGEFAQLFCILPDAIIGGLQYMFVTEEGIKDENGEYQIMYSPGVIFSGKIPAFDIDFITPNPSRIGKKTTKQFVSIVKALEVNGAIKKIDDNELENLKAGFRYDESRKIDLASLKGQIKSTQSENPPYDITTQELVCAWRNEDGTKIYAIVYYAYTMSNNEGFIENSENKFILYEMPSQEALKEATKIANTETEIITEKEYKSTAAILQNTISTWYNALKRIALVGLLSVLVYVGIKIVQSSSSAKNKAKYKEMLKNWLFALCILFTLHYVMSITITAVDKLCEVLQASTIGVNGQDILMSIVRNEIANSKDWAAAFTYVIIYDVLVVFTLIYTIQYVRRVIHIGFLTTIAPLITLTYPLDKIKDGKAQAFDMWLKDYIFFALLQVVHLLIYYIFLGSAIDLNNQGNWLFAIVAITFITVAEKFVKKMFGFDKAKSINAVAAGATGALVNNLMESLPLVGSVKKAKKKTNQAKTNIVRTATTNPLNVLTGEGAESLFASLGLIDGDSDSDGGDSGSDSGSSKNNFINKLIMGSKANIPAAIKGATTKTGKFVFSASKETLKFIVGANFALWGVGTGLADNSGSKGYVAGKAGKKAGENLVENVFNGVDNVIDKGQAVGEKVTSFVEGEETTQNKKFDRKFKNSSTYSKLKQKFGNNDKNFDTKIQQMLDAGITNPRKIERILEKNKKNPTKYSMENAMAFTALANMCTEEVLNDDDSFIRFCQDKDLNIAEDVLRAIRESVFEFK